MNNQPLLSICIPTWNRARFLKLSLDTFGGLFQDQEIAKYVELIISDNASADETQQIVESFIEKGLPVYYSKNEENIGADRNFLKCMNLASGKYILLLGDDDILFPSAVKFIIDKLKGSDFGLVHIHKYNTISEECLVYNNVEDFYKQISYWITFMSGSIFRKDVVSRIDSDKYIHSNLLQMPFYIASAQNGESNLLINREFLQCGLDGERNGGYNFYKVFVKNYLLIWGDFYNQNTISKDVFHYVKKDIYVRFIQKYNIKLLAQGKGIKKKDKDVEGKRNGFMIDGAWKYLFSCYGLEPYFYRSLLSIGYRYLRNRVGRIIKKYS